MNEEWFKLTNVLPLAGKTVWCRRAWLHQGSPRVSIILAAREDRELYTGDDPTEGCYWTNRDDTADSHWSDVTVTHWAYVRDPETFPNNNVPGGEK